MALWRGHRPLQSPRELTVVPVTLLLDPVPTDPGVFIRRRPLCALIPRRGGRRLSRGLIRYSFPTTYVDIGKARVTTPDGIFEPVRFLFRNHVAGAWAIDLDNDSATRVLFSADTTFIKRATAREEHVLVLPDNTQWLIRPLPSSGCGSCKKGVTKGLGTDILLDPNRTTIP